MVEDDVNSRSVPLENLMNDALHDGLRSFEDSSNSAVVVDGQTCDASAVRTFGGTPAILHCGDKEAALKTSHTLAGMQLGSTSAILQSGATPTSVRSNDTPAIMQFDRTLLAVQSCVTMAAVDASNTPAVIPAQLSSWPAVKLSKQNKKGKTTCLKRPQIGSDVETESHNLTMPSEAKTVKTIGVDPVVTMNQGVSEIVCNEENVEPVAKRSRIDLNNS